MFFPSPYDLAVLSKDACNQPKKDQDVNLSGWEKCDEITAKKGFWGKILSRLGISIRPRAVIYVNDEKRQLVLAYGGLSVRNIFSLMAIKNIIQKGIDGEKEFLIEAKKRFLEIAENTKKGYCLFTTGHSLGGWFAQLTTYFIKDDYRCPAIVFDSFGAFQILKSFQSNVDQTQKLDSLPITNYFSSPNLINCLYEPLGSVYRVVFREFPQQVGKYTVESHNIDNFINAFEKNGREKECHYVKAWPLLSVDNLNEITASGEPFGNVKALWGVWKFLKNIVTRKGLLGSYSRYFYFEKELKKCNYNINKVSGEYSLQKYGCKYDTEVCPSKHQFIHKRHLSEKAWSTVNRPDKTKILDRLKLSGFANAYVEKNVWLKIRKKNTDIRSLVDRLEQSILEKNSEHFTATENICNIEEPEGPRLLGRSNEEKQIENALNTSSSRHVCFLVGGPGYGKSHLAHSYAYKHKNSYSYAWWFNAEEEKTLFEDYRKLASKLKISEYNTRNNGELLQELNDTLKKRGGSCLFVYDNADNPEVLKNTKLKVNADILITSRKQQKSWGGYFKGTFISINGLALFDAEKFLSKHVSEEYTKRVKQTENEKQAITTLCTEVGCSPLGLKLIVGYMHGKIIEDYYIEEEGYQLSYENCLEEFQYNKLLFLEKGNQECETSVRGSITSTWELSLASLRKEDSDIAEKIYRFAFIESDAIPYDLIRELLGFKTNDLKKGVALLLDHSILTRQPEKSYHYCIDKLLQEVMRSKLEKNQQQDRVATDVINSIIKYWQWDYWIEFWRLDSKDYSRYNSKSMLVPHSTKIANYMLDNKHIFLKFKEHSLGLVGRLTCYYLKVTKQYKQIIHLLEPVIKYEKLIIGHCLACGVDLYELSDDLIHIYNNIGNAYFEEGYQGAIEYLLQARKIDTISSTEFLIHLHEGIDSIYNRQYDRAIKSCKKAESIYLENAISLSRTGLVMLYLCFGELYFREGNFGAVLDSYIKACSFFEGDDERLIEKKISRFRRLTKSTISKDIRKAIKKQEEILEELTLKYFNRDKLKLSTSYKNLSFLYALTGFIR